jgi:hypothetical protein
MVECKWFNTIITRNPDWVNHEISKTYREAKKASTKQDFATNFCLYSTDVIFRLYSFGKPICIMEAPLKPAEFSAVFETAVSKLYSKGAVILLVDLLTMYGSEAEDPIAWFKPLKDLLSFSLKQISCVGSCITQQLIPDLRFDFLGVWLVYLRELIDSDLTFGFPRSQTLFFVPKFGTAVSDFATSILLETVNRIEQQIRPEKTPDLCLELSLYLNLMVKKLEWMIQHKEVLIIDKDF